MKITISASGKNNSVYSTKILFISTEIFRSVYWHVRNFQWNRINTTAQYVQIIYIYYFILYIIQTSAFPVAKFGPLPLIVKELYFIYSRYHSNMLLKSFK